MYQNESSRMKIYFYSVRVIRLNYLCPIPRQGRSDSQNFIFIFILILIFIFGVFSLTPSLPSNVILAVCSAVIAVVLLELLFHFIALFFGLASTSRPSREVLCVCVCGGRAKLLKNETRAAYFLRRGYKAKWKASFFVIPNSDSTMCRSANREKIMEWACWKFSSIFLVFFLLWSNKLNATFSCDCSRATKKKQQ